MSIYCKPLLGNFDVSLTLIDLYGIDDNITVITSVLRNSFGICHSFYHGFWNIANIILIECLDEFYYKHFQATEWEFTFIVMLFITLVMKTFKKKIALVHTRTHTHTHTHTHIHTMDVCKCFKVHRSELYYCGYG